MIRGGHLNVVLTTKLFELELESGLAPAKILSANVFEPGYLVEEERLIYQAIDADAYRQINTSCIIFVYTGRHKTKKRETHRAREQSRYESFRSANDSPVDLPNMLEAQEQAAKSLRAESHAAELAATPAFEQPCTRFSFQEPLPKPFEGSPLPLPLPLPLPSPLPFEGLHEAHFSTCPSS